MPPNIAVVVLDTLRKDSFEEHFDWMPGTIYENAWSTSHWTVPVHGSLFTGKYPSEVGVYAKHETMDYPDPILPELLCRHGYTTYAYSANPFISSEYNFDRGFDHFVSGWRVLSSKYFDWSTFSDIDGPRPIRYLRAILNCLVNSDSALQSLYSGWRQKKAVDDGAEYFLEMIKSRQFQDGEFLFMNLMEAHMPYSPPQSYRTVDTNTAEVDITKDTLQNNPVNDKVLSQAYDDSVRYLSDIYREIFDVLREDFEYIITLSDHGELFGEQNAWSHFSGLYPELTNIPVAIFNGSENQTLCEEVVSVVDLYQTVLSLSGIDRQSRGRDLFSSSNPQERLVEYHGLTYPRIRKCTDDLDLSSLLVEKYDTELFGLVSPGNSYFYQTPDGERETGEGDVADPAERMSALIGSLDKRDLSDSRSDTPKSVRQQLENLGYA